MSRKREKYTTFSGKLVRTFGKQEEISKSARSFLLRLDYPADLLRLFMTNFGVKCLACG